MKFNYRNIVLYILILALLVTSVVTDISVVKADSWNKRAKKYQDGLYFLEYENEYDVVTATNISDNISCYYPDEPSFAFVLKETVDGDAVFSAVDSERISVQYSQDAESFTDIDIDSVTGSDDPREITIVPELDIFEHLQINYFDYNKAGTYKFIYKDGDKEYCQYLTIKHRAWDVYETRGDLNNPVRYYKVTSEKDVLYLLDDQGDAPTGEISGEPKVSVVDARDIFADRQIETEQDWIDYQASDGIISVNTSKAPVNIQITLRVTYETENNAQESFDVTLDYFDNNAIFYYNDTNGKIAYRKSGSNDSFSYISAICDGGDAYGQLGGIEGEEYELYLIEKPYAPDGYIWGTEDDQKYGFRAGAEPVVMVVTADGTINTYCVNGGYGEAAIEQYGKKEVYTWKMTYTYHAGDAIFVYWSELDSFWYGDSEFMIQTEPQTTDGTINVGGNEKCGEISASAASPYGRRYIFSENDIGNAFVQVIPSDGYEIKSVRIGDSILKVSDKDKGELIYYFTAEDVKNADKAVVVDADFKAIDNSEVVTEGSDEADRLAESIKNFSDKWDKVGYFEWTYDAGKQYLQDEDGKVLSSANGNPISNADYLEHGRLEIKAVNYWGYNYSGNTIWSHKKIFDLWEDKADDNTVTGGGAVLPVNATVTVKVIPDKGYQLSSFSLNGGNYKAGDDPLTYSFVVKSGRIHIGAEFTEIKDSVDVESDLIVSSGNITLDEEEFDTGSASLSVNSTYIFPEEMTAFETAASDYRIDSYFDMQLYHVMYQGNATEFWADEILTPKKECEITLTLSKQLEGKSVAVIVEKTDGECEIIPSVYDSDAGTVSFKTKQFSKTAIAIKDSPIKHNHSVVYVAGVEPDCNNAGHIAYYVCNDCGKYFEDKNAAKQLGQEELVSKALGHLVEKVEGVAATCNSAGHITYYTCGRCGEYFSDKKCRYSIEKDSWITQTTGHSPKSVIEPADEDNNGYYAKKCENCGELYDKTVVFAVKSVQISGDTFEYTGEEIHPRVTVTDIRGGAVSASNYTVTYGENTEIGKGTVKITFKNYYKGTETRYIKIIPKDTSITNASAGKNSAEVEWEKISGMIDGYQLQYSTDDNFEEDSNTINIKSYRTTKYVVNNLKARKKCYVRVRTYKKVSDKYYYSEWSETKTVTPRR